MIIPADGVAFTLAADGDARSDPKARSGIASRLGITAAWGVVDQVHGSSVVEVIEPGDHGEADALFTRTDGVPVAVFTADCFGVVLKGDGGVGVAHAGWRGAEAGVVVELRRRMEETGVRVDEAFIGPGIGRCCFEVGPEVADRFGGFLSTTTWGTTSVDLVGFIRHQLTGVETWNAEGCTMHHPGHHSHRASGTPARMAALAWLMRDSAGGS